MNKTNIVVLSGHSSVESGGVGTHLKVLIDELENDQETNVSTLLGKGNLGKAQVLLNRFFRNTVSYGLSEMIDFFINIYHLKYRLQSLLNQSPDKKYIVHAHDRSSAIAAGLLKDKYSIKIIQTIHAPYHQEYLINAKLPQDSLMKHFIHSFAESTLCYVDNFIAVDDLQKNLMLRDFYDNVTTDQITVVPNAVENSLFNNQKKRADKKNKYIVVSRHFFKKNGVEYAIKAFNALLNKNELKMYLLGSGDEYINLVNIVKKYKLEKYVLFKGKVSRAESIKMIEGAMVSLVPSVIVGDYIEATSLTMLETMALRTPLIASNIGGIKQVLSGKNAACLVEPEDYISIAKHIDNLFECPSCFDGKIENAYKLAKNNHSSKSWYEDIKTVYNVT